MESSAHNDRGQGDPTYLPGVDSGRHEGLIYTALVTESTVDHYAKVLGPSARESAARHQVGSAKVLAPRSLAPPGRSQGSESVEHGTRG